MAIKGRQPDVDDTITKEYNRRLYVDIGETPDYMSTMLRVTEKEKQDARPEPHSEFKKPYLEEDFHEMEYNFMPPQMPWFSWGNPWTWNTPTDYIYNWSPETMAQYQEETSASGGGNLYCILTCYSWLYCDEDIHCVPSIMQTYTPYSGMAGVSFWIAAWNYPRTVKISVGDPANPVFPLRVEAPEDDWNSWPAEDQDILTLCMRDPVGNECCTEVEVFCYDRCICDEQPPLSYPTSNPTVIGLNDSITIMVEGGCPPYNFSHGGATGFYFTYISATDDPWNTLNTNSLACGTATITVTDNCGGSVTGYVQAPVGHWDSAHRVTICGVSENQGFAAIPTGHLRYVFIFGIGSGTHCTDSCPSLVLASPIATPNYAGQYAYCKPDGHIYVAWDRSGGTTEQAVKGTHGLFTEAWVC